MRATDGQSRPTGLKLIAAYLNHPADALSPAHPSQTKPRCHPSSVSLSAFPRDSNWLVSNGVVNVGGPALSKLIKLQASAAMNTRTGLRMLRATAPSAVTSVLESVAVLATVVVHVRCQSTNILVLVPLPLVLLLLPAQLRKSSLPWILC
jgi:hypothetical protein